MAETKPVMQAPLNKARKDKFVLVLTIPNIMKGLNVRTKRGEFFLNLDSLQFSVYNITVPKLQVTHEELHIYGQNYNVTGYNRPPYPPVSVNFAVDNEFKNYWVLWKWQELLNDPLQSTYASKNIFPNGKPELMPPGKYDYVTDITVFAKDEYNNDKAVFLFKNSFISTLGELSYNYRDPEETDCYFEFVFNQLDIHLV